MERLDDPRILVADANPEARASLANLLAKWGYSVTLAADGNQAWDILRSESAPRLAILDWSMSGMEGIEVCRRVRSATGLHYTYTVILTSRSKSEDLVQALDAGADDCIAKPFRPQELRARLMVGFRIIRLQERLIRAREELYEHATRDGLTGLWNRRNIVEILENEIARARRSGTPLAVVMADIDHFKRINDKYGHFAGDDVLRDAARRMKSAIRQYDSIGRYGGEEFLIVVPGCDLMGSVAVAERLRRATEAYRTTMPDSPPVVTCSFGVAWVENAAAITADQLLRDSDAALYLAKRAGRNRVEAKTIYDSLPEGQLTAFTCV